MILRNERLRRLLDIRRLKEASSRQDLGLAMRAEEDAQEVDAKEQERLEKTQGAVCNELSSGPLTSDALMRMTSELGFRESNKEASAKVHRKEVSLRLRAEQRYQQARRDSKSLERLDDRIRRDEFLERKRAEQRISDEAALRRFMVRGESPSETLDERNS